jgi:hypothetical protein
MRIASVLGGMILIGGCASAPPPAPATVQDPRLLELARSYAKYGRVDDVARRAPTSCEAPAQRPPRLSSSRDLETHGRKLAFLFAKNREAYLHVRELAQPAGQVIVKEAWVPAATSTMLDPVTGEKGPLFIMFKTGEPDSDEGWIYATLTPDGKTVTASGKIASCMECHQSAPHDRLFGLKSCASPQ